MRRFAKGITMIVALFIALFVGGNQQVLAGSETETNITILHTNDIHGRVVDGLGFARISTIVNDFRQENPNTLLLDAEIQFMDCQSQILSRGKVLFA